MAFGRFQIHRLTWNLTWLYTAIRVHFGQNLNFTEWLANELWILNDHRSATFWIIRCICDNT